MGEIERRSEEEREGGGREERGLKDSILGLSLRLRKVMDSPYHGKH